MPTPKIRYINVFIKSTITLWATCIIANVVLPTCSYRYKMNHNFVVIHNKKQANIPKKENLSLLILTYNGLVQFLNKTVYFGQVRSIRAINLEKYCPNPN